MTIALTILAIALTAAGAVICSGFRDTETQLQQSQGEQP